MGEKRERGEFEVQLSDYASAKLAAGNSLKLYKGLIASDLVGLCCLIKPAVLPFCFRAQSTSTRGRYRARTLAYPSAETNSVWPFCGPDPLRYRRYLSPEPTELSRPDRPLSQTVGLGEPRPMLATSYLDGGKSVVSCIHNT